MFKEVAAWAQDCEFLKRQYNYIGKTGQDQLFPRIQLLAKFFSKKPTLGSFYPTMIPSNTKFIFMKRFHRITKTQDPNDTSNNCESSVHSDSGILNLGITHINSSNCFLKNLNCDISYSGSSSSSLSYRNTLKMEFYDYDEKAYNIYEAGLEDQLEDIQRKNSIKKVQKKIQSSIISINNNSQQLQKDVSHLICDYEEVDFEETLKNYAKYCKLQNIVPLHQKTGNTNENVYPYFITGKSEERKQRRSKQLKSKQKKLATKICIEPLDSNNTYDTTKPSYNGNFFQAEAGMYEPNQKSTKHNRFGASEISEKFLKFKPQKSSNIYYSPRQYPKQYINRKHFLEQREENYQPRSYEKPLIFIINDEPQFLRRDRKKYLRDKAAELLGRKTQYELYRSGASSKWSNNYY